MRDSILALVLLLPCACAAGSARPSASPLPAAGRAPYDAAPVTSSRIDIAIDANAARGILASLAKPKPEASDLKVLEQMAAVSLAIQDSTREPAVFERDFAAAFEGDARAAVFDFRTVRERRELWETLIEAVLARQADLLGLSRRRAAALLPSNIPTAASLQVAFSFGLPGLEDHLVLRSAGGPGRMVIDFARALGDMQSETLDSQLSRLSRLIGGEAFLEAWNAYREESPAWKSPDPRLGQLEPLLKLVAAAGPAALYTVDESFFPLAVWLKDPNKRAVDDLNRRAERFGQAQDNLEERMALMSEVRRPDFGRRIAGPVGAFLADAIAQDAGAAGLRVALEQGPKAFFVAYDQATQKDKNLIPLAKAIRDRLK